MVNRVLKRVRRLRAGRPRSLPVFERDVALWPYWPVAALLVTGFLVMTWPWLTGLVTIPWDAKAHFLPQIQFLAQSIARGESPFWAPYVFSGHPQVADPQSMMFSPPFLLLALVSSTPSLRAVDLTVLLTMLAGAAALVLWFRDQGWHWAGGLIAGLVFMFGAAMAWRLQHTGQVLSLAYLPMAMVALERTIRRGSWVYGALLGFMAAVILLGRDQVAMLALYFLAGLGIWRIVAGEHVRDRTLRAMAPLGLAGVITLVLIAVPLLLTLDLAAASNRPSIDFEGAGRGSLHPAMVLTTLAPQIFGAAGHMADFWGPPSFAWADTGLNVAQNMGQLYIGAAPILLVMLALIKGQLWAREVRFFTVAFIVFGLYALGWYTPVFRAIYELAPGVKLYRRPADAVFLIGAMGAILAGYATHRLFTTPWIGTNDRQMLAMAYALGLALAVALLVAYRLDRLALVLWPLMLAAACLAIGAASIYAARSRVAVDPWVAAMLLASVTALDLGLNNGPSTSSALPRAHYDALEPDTNDAGLAFLKARVAETTSPTRRDRVELAGLGFHWPNASLTHRLENTLGYNPLRLGLYARATGAEDHVGLPDQRKFSPLLPSYRSKLVDLLGLRWIATGAPMATMDPRVRADDFRLAYEGDGKWIYENPRALPRVLFVEEAAPANFEQIVALGLWPEFNAERLVLLDQGRVPGRAEQLRVVTSRPSVPASTASPASSARSAFATVPPRGSVRIMDYANTRVEIGVESEAGGYAVLNDLWHPWWRVTVNGAPATMLRANVLFRAVEVPAGKHTLVFEFAPVSSAIAARFGG